jgi:uncharacterized SAM-binding protein YcdF (DUF218 family)
MASLVDPACILWAILLLAGLFFLVKRQRLAGVSLLTLGVAWWLIEVTAVPARLLASLEAPYLGTADREGPVLDAIIVLGGGVGVSDHEFVGLDFGMATDRILTGIDLARRGQGRVLVLGGSATRHPELAPEAGRLMRWIERWQLVDLPILDLGPCRNTRDEAVRAVELAREHDWNQVLLVTSAGHLPRAEAAFRRVGLDVVPVGCDFVGTASLDRPRRWIPQSQSLVLLQLALREVVGGYYYRWREWAR